MGLIRKVSAISLSSVTVAGISALYSYTISIENNKKFNKVKDQKRSLKWAKAKSKPAYKGCVEEVKSEDICGWLYNGI